MAKIREDIAQSVDSETKEEENVGEQAEGDAPPVERPQPVAVIEAIQPPPHPIEAIETEVDALLAHREFLEGKLPNVFAEKSNGQDACELKNRDHGRLMSRIKLRISGSILKAYPPLLHDNDSYSYPILRCSSGGSRNSTLLRHLHDGEEP